MAYVTRSVEVDIDVELDDFDDDELIYELEARGYNISKERNVWNAIEAWERGDKKEALVLFEREYPELIGLSKILN